MDFRFDNALKAALLGVGCLLTSCANLQAVSSPKIGCPQEEIHISNDDSGWGSRTWTADCRGRRFFCGATSTGKSSADISCTPEAAPLPVPVPVPVPVPGPAPVP
jgi:hypothetical protein